jgi:dolichyl-phosphate beta-glucosyltransferase
MLECSLVIPAYQEAKRLPRYLKSVREYLTTNYGNYYEVIVVDDGSDDGLVELLQPFQADWSQLRVIRHVSNRGKGAAVRSGMLKSTGKVLLFADADGATPINEEQSLRRSIESGADISIGSRYLKSDRTKRKRGPVRKLGSMLLRSVVRYMVKVPVTDTQCGFKMFRREVGLKLFSLCNEDGYLFDVFILRLAERLGYRVQEVGVNWEEVGGSHVRLVRDFYTMWRRLRHLEKQVDRALEMNSSLSSEQYINPGPNTLQTALTAKNVQLNK